MQMRLHWWVFLHCLCLQPYIVLLRLFSCEGSYLSGKEVSAAGSSIIEHTIFSGTWRGLIRKLFYECSLKKPGCLSFTTSRSQQDCYQRAQYLYGESESARISCLLRSGDEKRGKPDEANDIIFNAFFFPLSHSPTS